MWGRATNRVGGAFRCNELGRADLIARTFVHVLNDGQIIKSGDKSLALEVEEKGYDWLIS